MGIIIEKCTSIELLALMDENEKDTIDFALLRRWDYTFQKETIFHFEFLFCKLLDYAL